MLSPGAISEGVRGQSVSGVSEAEGLLELVPAALRQLAPRVEVCYLAQ